MIERIMARLGWIRREFPSTREQALEQTIVSLTNVVEALQKERSALQKMYLVEMGKREQAERDARRDIIVRPSRDEPGAIRIQVNQ